MVNATHSESEERLLGGLGLAARAGRVKVGLDSVGRAIRRGEARAIVIAEDAPKSVRRRLEGLLSNRAIPHSVVLDGDRLGKAVGRQRVVVLALTDDSLGRRVIELAVAVGS